MAVSFDKLNKKFKNSSLQLAGWFAVWGHVHSKITSPTKPKLTGESKKLGLGKIPWAQRVKKLPFWYKFDIFDQKGIFLPISSQKIENPTWSRFLSANLGLGKVFS